MESLKSRKVFQENNHYQKSFIIKSKANVNGTCKKHPKHKQCPGVCSLCLSERLSQLRNSNETSSSSSSSSSRRRRGTKSAISSSSSSDLSSLSSSNASSCSSPIVNYSCRLDLNGRKSTRVLGLKKSRSMASVFRRRKDQDDEKKDNNGKKGFWSKILPRKHKGLSMHSKTTRERIITAVR